MYKKSISKVIGNIVLATLMMIGISLIFSVNRTNLNTLVILTFLINLILIISQIFKDSKLGYSLYDIVFIFLCFFMFLSPLLQYLNNKFPWNNSYDITDELIIYSNMVITLFMIVFILIYKIFNEITIKCTTVKNINVLLKILFVLSCIATYLIIKDIGIKNIFSRYTSLSNVYNQALSLIYISICRSITVINAGINLLCIKLKNNKSSWIFLLMSFILMMLTNWPTGVSRYWCAVVYLGVIIIAKGSFKHKKVFKYIMIFGVIIVFPVINIFRSYSFQSVIKNNLNINITSQYLTGNFDAYSMLVRSIIYTRNAGFSIGRQLLGNVLFFVPRDVWHNKPVGSGCLIAKYYGWDFTNVSCPFIGEGFINYGITGVVIFAVILGVLCKCADKKYSYLILEEKNRKITYMDLIYPFTIGYLFFILRGDLLSSLSYYISFLVCVFLVYILDKIFSLIKQ